MKSIYTYYKERLIEISGRNRSLYAKKISKKYAFDIGKIFDGDYDTINEFIDFLWRDRRYSFPLIKKDDKERLAKNLGVEHDINLRKQNLEKLEGKEKSEEAFKIQRVAREETKKALLSQINDLKNLKRDIEEFARETGRYEMYVGYPFVTGYIGKDLQIKAPLILFPCIINIIDEQTCEIELKRDENIQLNKVFILAYAKHYRLNVEDLEMEFRSPLSSSFKNINAVVEYLRKFGIKLSYQSRKGMFNYERVKDPSPNDGLDIKQLCVLGRFPLANSIYNDYTALEKRRLTNEAINELLNTTLPKKIKKVNTNLYTINDLDYAQTSCVMNVNIDGNMVIYGPPGTGKSQTIVNIISDALCKHKRVLVVSQKKAALDVVFNRLGTLNNKVMFITDPEKNKNEFYERARTTHLETLNYTFMDFMENYENIRDKITCEERELKIISDTLFEPTEFGISLQQMYANSHIIGKNTYEYTVYKNIQNAPKLLDLTYQELEEALRVIKEKKKGEHYYNYLEAKKNNPIIDKIKADLNIHTINSAISKLKALTSSRVVPFDTAKYPNSKQLIAYYLDKKIDTEDLKPLVKFVAKIDNEKAYNTLQTSYVLLPLLPFAKHKTNQIEQEIEENFRKTLDAIDEYIKDYTFLQEVLTEDGYIMMVDNILNGNTLYLKLLINALTTYVDIRDLNNVLSSLSDNEKIILNFAYKSTESYARFKDTLDMLMCVRIYIEIVKLEEKYKINLSKILDYENTRNRILSLNHDLKDVCRNICDGTFKDDYIGRYDGDQENKNFLYQISKTQNQWPIRRFMEVYGDYMFDLFPCWLLSPESVSTIMPLKKNLFDIVLFDEASQVFVENTLPVIYRGKNIVVAGDSKQLRPTATFMKRYLGADVDENLDYSTQAALEVESLLDLAMTRYKCTHLTYHYRSRNEELINFSNHAFYEGRLQIAPNTTKNKGKKPIERILVDGKWIGRHNDAEAQKVVDIVKKIFKTRKRNQSIGIITFNTEQESAIEDALDAECAKDPKFRDQYLLETNRKENGEDTSLFIKNLENVQGDERDIIIFSIGYAKNEYGRVVAQFGPLSVEGGENRLNVAITRAKEKIYVVTSIEPEELNVENSKNAGPKIFKSYLRYVRAVSNGNALEAQLILNSYDTQETPKLNTVNSDFEGEIKKELEKLGYNVATNIGNTDYKISLAIYDKDLDRYLIGIECDYTAYQSSDSLIERDVYHPAFLKSRGWELLRVYSRDWWLHKGKVLAQITKIAERTRAKYLSEQNEVETTKSKKAKKSANKTSTSTANSVATQTNPKTANNKKEPLPSKNKNANTKTVNSNTKNTNISINKKINK